MKRIVFISSNIHTPWGGSEVLWYKAAMYLLSYHENIEVVVVARKWHSIPFHIKEISDAGGNIVDLPMEPSTPLSYLKSKIIGSTENRKKKLIQNLNPDLIVHSMGKSFEGGDWMEIAHFSNVPYINVIQLSSDFQWPDNDEIDRYIRGYSNACKNLFVSHANKNLVSKQLGVALKNSSVVRNPITVSRTPLPYPDTTCGYSLALPAQLVPIHKGQDILLEVLAQKKWKSRPVTLNLYGEGAHKSSLHHYCRCLGLEQVNFKGYSTDISKVWEQNHMLIMSSRMEGLPLTLVEAMTCGRPSIVTAVAGMPELIEEGKTGFIAKAPLPEFMDEALEKAWHMRAKWQEMGKLAAVRAKDLIPYDPVEKFVHILLEQVS